MAVQRKFLLLDIDSGGLPLSASFTYVVYSQKNRDKYLRHLMGKLKGRKIPEVTQDKKQNEIYYKFLQALSTHIEVVCIRIRPGIE